MGMKPEAAYEELIHWSQQDSLLASCVELLGWDEETYLPRGGVAHRGRQMALLAGLCHERVTDPRVGELLAEVEGSALVADTAVAEAVNVRVIRRVTTAPAVCREPWSRRWPTSPRSPSRNGPSPDGAPILPGSCRGWKRIVALKRPRGGSRMAGRPSPTMPCWKSTNPAPAPRP